MNKKLSPQEARIAKLLADIREEKKYDLVGGVVLPSSKLKNLLGVKANGQVAGHLCNALDLLQTEGYICYFMDAYEKTSIIITEKGHQLLADAYGDTNQ